MGLARQESCADIQIKIKEGNGDWKTPSNFIVHYISQVNKLSNGFEIGVTNAINLPKDSKPETISSYIYSLCDVINRLSLQQAEEFTSCRNALTEAMHIIEDIRKMEDKKN